MSKSDFKHEYLFVLGNGASIASAHPKLKKLLQCTPSIENFVSLMDEISQVNQNNPCELSERMDANHLEILINGYVQRVFEISKEKSKTNIVKLLASLTKAMAKADKEKAATNQSGNDNSKLLTYTEKIDPIQEDINTLIGAIYLIVAAYYTNYNDEYFARLWQIVQKTKSPVVSLNWDINFEKMVCKETKIPMKNYYGKCAFGCLHPDEQSDGIDPVIDILKPHGSLNWYFIDQPNNEYHLNISDDFDKGASADYVLQYLGFLIPPVPENEFLYFYSNRFWEKKTLIKEDIFSRIREYAASTRTLVIIGYSFPPDDEHIKELFTNNRFENVVVFDTNEEVFQRIKGYFPKATAEFKKGGFADIMNWPPEK
jgi:hypothetical protein